MGHSNVTVNYKLRDNRGNLSEIDIVTGRWLWRTFVECKHYESKSVPLEDVAKFKEVLRMNGVSANRGLFITNSTFSPRATEVGIRTIDGAELQRLHTRYGRFSILRIIRQLRGAMVLGMLGGVGYIVASGLNKGFGAPSKDLNRWKTGYNSRMWTQHSKDVLHECQQKMALAA